MMMVMMRMKMMMKGEETDEEGRRGRMTRRGRE